MKCWKYFGLENLNLILVYKQKLFGHLGLYFPENLSLAISSQREIRLKISCTKDDCGKDFDLCLYIVSIELEPT